jgi:hypothetical protein
LKTPQAAIISVTILLTLSACTKHISGHYVCRQDAFQFQPNGAFAISDVKTGAPELKGTYKIKGDRIELVPDKARHLMG